MHDLAGKPAEGNDSFDRGQQTRRIWERLETDNILLLAPPTVGI